MPKQGDGKYSTKCTCNFLREVPSKAAAAKSIQILLPGGQNFWLVNHVGPGLSRTLIKLTRLPLHQAQACAMRNRTGHPVCVGVLATTLGLNVPLGRPNGKSSDSYRLPQSSFSDDAGTYPLPCTDSTGSSVYLCQEGCLLSRTADAGASDDVNMLHQCITATETWYFSLPLVGKVGRAVSRRFSRKKRDLSTPSPKLRIGRTTSFAELNSPVLSHGQRSGNLSEHGVRDALLVCHL